MKLLSKVALVLCLGLVTALPGAAQADHSESLQMTLIRAEVRSAKPLFRIELHNAGDQPLILNLGMMLANGRKQYADAIHLSLTDARGRALPLELKGPAFVAGRIDPLVVPLPQGATITLPVDLTDYSSPKEHVWELSLAPGRYKLSAKYSGAGVFQRQANLDMKGISLMPYWTGTVESNVVEFTTSRAVGK